MIGARTCRARPGLRAREQYKYDNERGGAAGGEILGFVGEVMIGHLGQSGSFRTSGRARTRLAKGRFL